MDLIGKDLCGKNIYFIKKPNRLSMYHHDKKVGEIELNEKGNAVYATVYCNRYLKNLIFYINSNKNLVIDELKGFPCDYKNLNKIKERLHPDVLLRYATIASSIKLVRYALEREAFFTKETFVNSAIHSAVILEMYLKISEDYIEDAMQAAFENRNYDCIKILSKKTNNLGKYIEFCSQKEKYQVIKKILVAELVQRSTKRP